MAEEIEDRIYSLERWREDMNKRFADAFPGADHIGHCRYHELLIEDIESRKRLRQAVLEKTIAGLVWSAIIGLGIATWSTLVNFIRGSG